MEVELTQPIKRKATLQIGGKKKKSRSRFSASLGIQRVAADKQRVCLSYGYDAVLPAVAVSGIQVFNLNSFFDPDRTGAGAQPNGFDQWAAFYQRYIVHTAMVNYSWSSAGTATQTLNCVVHASNTDSNVSVSTLMGTPNTRFGQAQPQGGVFKGTMKINLWKLAGRTRAQYMADDLNQALISASPSTLLICRFRGEDAAGANTSGHLQVRLTMWGEFFDRIQLAQS